MKTILLFLMLFLSLASTSCTPEEIRSSQGESEQSTIIDPPPSEESGEEEEIEPNN